MANIVFVDENDTVIGSGTKQEVWEKGIRHRIVRIFVFNSQDQVLLAQRGPTLASLPNRWNESAAGHVDEGEEYQDAAEREFTEELGIAGIQVVEVGRFKSEETDEPDKKKNRFTAVYIARHDGAVQPSPREVAATKWLSAKDAYEWMKRSPDDFTEGCILGFELLIERHIVII